MLYFYNYATHPKDANETMYYLMYFPDLQKNPQQK